MGSARAEIEPPGLRVLRAKALRSSAWSLAGSVVQQTLRLCGNLVTTRLLFPEAFGLMALVQIAIQAVQMFSDVGLNGGVIRSKRGDEGRFLDAAWTIQVIRGACIWIVVSIAAGPIASFYGQPDLRWMIPVVGLASVMSGFQSTAVWTLRRGVEIRPLVVIGVVAQLAGLGVTIGWALVSPSVVALIAGGLARAVAHLGLSYRLRRVRIPRVRWEWEAARELYRYGRWIFVGTALTFLLREGDKAVVGKMLNSAELGVFSIAALWPAAAVEAVNTVAARVLFPMYARLANTAPASLRGELLRARVGLLGVALPGIWLLAIGGAFLIEVLYDERYRDAGWMLQVLSVGAVGSVISTSNHGVLLAKGDSYRHMLLQGARGILLVAGMAAGATLAGFEGLLIGVAASRFADYPMVAWFMHRYDAWLPRLDAAAYASSLLAIGVGLWLQSG